MQFSAALGAPFGDKTAQEIGEMLEALGEFTPRTLVDMGRDERSVLHPYFEWDNQTAAERYRLHQARQIVNHIQIVIKVNGKDVPTKAFHHISVMCADDSVSDTYVTVRIARENDELKTQIIQKALSELKSWQRRYAEYSQIFGELFVEINKTIPQVESRIEPIAMQ